MGKHVAGRGGGGDNGDPRALTGQLASELLAESPIALTAAQRTAYANDTSDSRTLRATSAATWVWTRPARAPGVAMMRPVAGRRASAVRY